jgi:hypothetical protein
MAYKGRFAISSITLVAVPCFGFVKPSWLLLWLFWTLLNVPGRITKAKRRIQVKNLARRVCIIKVLLRSNSRRRSVSLVLGSAGPPAVVVASGSLTFSGSGP